jgi:hypothetical protein
MLQIGLLPPPGELAVHIHQHTTEYSYTVFQQMYMRGLYYNKNMLDYGVVKTISKD